MNLLYAFYNQKCSQDSTLCTSHSSCFLDWFDPSRDVRLPALVWKFLENWQVDPKEGGIWGEKRTQPGIMSESPPYTSVISFRGTDLCPLEINCNSGGSAGHSCRLKTLWGSLRTVRQAVGHND